MKEKEENVKQKEFINSALTKLKDNLTKFIVDTNYSNIQSLYLRQQIDTYEKDILKQNQSRKNLSVNYKSLNNETILPLLISNKNPNKLYDKNKIYNYVKGKSSIYVSPEFGPSFGNSVFEIKDKFLEMGGVCSEDHFYDNQEKGCEINNGNEQFDIKEIEVFEVLF